MKITKTILLVLVAGSLAALVGLRVYSAYEKKSMAASAGAARGRSRVVTVSLGQAYEGAVREEILLTGSLKPKEQVDLTARATGRLEMLRHQVGDLVRKGELVAQLEDAELQQQVNRAKAAQAVARAAATQREAELRNAKADVGRAKALFEARLIPRQEYESRQTSYQVMEAQVELAKAQEQQAEAELKELRIRLEQTRVFSPMTGHVAQRYVDIGALISPSTPILRIVNLSTMVTAANVPERQLSKLRVGTTAQIEVDALPGAVVKGRVARISPVLDPATRTALVEVEIPNPNATLKAEMFARVTLDLASTRKAILIPREGLVYRGSQPGVYVMQGERPVFRAIETGATEGGEVEVLANLSPGTAIVTRGATMLTEGDAIRVAGKEASKGPGGGRPPAQ